MRHQACFQAVSRALLTGRRTSGARLVHYSVQANHVHLLVEADDKRALSSVMRGWGSGWRAR